MFSDEPIKDSDSNTVSLRREIAVVDVNDNPPEFLGRPYSFAVSENAQVGTIIFNNITVVDKDIGPNSEISLTCVQNNEPCVTFNLLTEKVSHNHDTGNFIVFFPLFPFFFFYCFYFTRSVIHDAIHCTACFKYVYCKSD